MVVAIFVHTLQNVLTHLSIGEVGGTHHLLNCRYDEKSVVFLVDDAPEHVFADMEHEMVWTRVFDVDAGNLIPLSPHFQHWVIIREQPDFDAFGHRSYQGVVKHHDGGLVEQFLDVILGSLDFICRILLFQKAVFQAVYICYGYLR